MAAAAHTIRFRLERDGDGLLAQCTCCQVIIVSGRNRKEVRERIKECITGYVEAFPLARERFFEGDRMKRVVLA